MVAVVVVVGVVVAFLAFRPETIVRDPETNCPERGPSALTAIYLDTTDRVNPVSREDIVARLEETVAGTAADEMVAVFRSAPAGDGEQPLESLLTRCNPGDPETASELTQNPRLIRRRLAEEFRAPLDRVFRETLDAAPADVSALMENIQAISVALLSRVRYRDLPKRLVVVSDLLQHSGNLSLYGDVPAYSTFGDTLGAAALGLDLRDVSVEVLLVQRPQHERSGGPMDVIEFWTSWVEDQGGWLGRVTRISGLNPG